MHLHEIRNCILGYFISGIYGLKSDIHDVTKLVDEISVNRLLDGTYKCPSLGKDKGKKAVSTNENILHSVRKACSLLQLRRPVQSQQFSETDCSSNRKLSTCSANSFSCVASNINGDKGDAYRMDLSTCYKVSMRENLRYWSVRLQKMSTDGVTIPGAQMTKNLDNSVGKSIETSFLLSILHGYWYSPELKFQNYIFHMSHIH